MVFIATAGVTTCFGLLEVGYVADLLVVDGDPLADIGSLRGPRAVIARGVPVHADHLESPPG